MKQIKNASEYKSYKEEATWLMEEADAKSKQLSNQRHDFEITSVSLDLTEGRLLIINKAIAGDYLPDLLFEELGDFKTIEDLETMKTGQEKILANLNRNHHDLSIGIYTTEKELKRIKSRLKLIKRMLMSYRVYHFVKILTRTKGAS